MSKQPRDLRQPCAAPSTIPYSPVSFDPVALPGAPPASPKGRVLYENLGIRIDRDGTWFYHGSAIQRKELVCLFASALTRDGEGRYWLVTPTEMGPIEVEDAPFIVVELFAASHGREQLISMRTNIDEIVTLNDEHPLHITPMAECETMPYVVLRRGLEARLSRSVYYDLVALGCETECDGARQFGVWSSGRFFPMGTLDPAR